MPCYQSQIMSVELSAADRAVLERVLKKFGHKFSKDGLNITLKNGAGTIQIDPVAKTATFSSNLAPLVNEIRVGYARECISTVANKLGWSKTAAGANKLKLSKGV